MKKKSRVLLPIENQTRYNIRRPFHIILSIMVLALFTMISTHAETNPNDNVDPQYFHVAAPFTLKELHSFDIERRLTGTISARQHADIGFEQGGKIAEILVDEGDTVNASALVAKLDTALLDIEARQLRAQLADATSRLKLAKSSLTRQLELKQRGFSSDQQLDELETEKASLTATISSIRAAQASIQSRIEKAVLKAPFGGVVTKRFADVGTVVGSGNAVIRLQQEGSMEAHVGVPIRLLPHLEKILQNRSTASVEINSVPMAAEVLTVSADMNPITRTVQARLLLPRAANIVNGDLMTLLLAENVQKSGFWVPITAITDGMRGLWTVYVLQPTLEKSDNSTVYKIEARDVQVEYATEKSAFVQGSLSSDELIAQGGLNRFAPGQHVILAQPEELLPPLTQTYPRQGE